MSAPELSHLATDLYEGMESVAWADATYGYPLAHYLQALALMLDEAADLSRDGEDGTTGWSALFDLQNVPAKYLPWLGQFVGVRLAPRLTETQQRDQIAATSLFRRGTRGAFIGAAQNHLIGTRTVFVQERSGGNAYRVRAAVFQTEAPASDVAGTTTIVKDALLAQKPAGLVLDFSIVTTWSVATEAAAYATVAAVTAAFATCAAEAANDHI